MMKNDNKGRDIFYGVIAVATLIVAMVGATLAYFSITVSSNEGAINATSATVSIEYNDGQQVSAQADKLIPATLDVVKKVYEKNVKTISSSNEPTANACIDDNDQQVCSTYRFTVRSDIEREISATLNNEHNGFTYLGYAVYDVTNSTWLSLDDDNNQSLALTTCSNEETGEETEIADCYTSSGTTKTYDSSRAVNSIFGITNDGGITKNKTQQVASATQVYDLVLFIKENEANQNIDQGKNYRGTIIVDVVGLNGNITGYVKE